MNHLHPISCVLITKNCADTLPQTLDSVKDWVDEIVMIDDCSTDTTRDIGKKYGARVLKIAESHEGRQRILSLKHATYEWILSLDSDEVISSELKQEIEGILNTKQPNYDGYRMQFQNHFLGHPVAHGGESYRMLRLFRKSKVTVDNESIHSQFHVKDGKEGILQNKLLHYSYRSLQQVYSKFTKYAIREAHKKIKNGEKTGIKKVTMYPIHMFYARYIEDKGYKDGWQRIPLDLGFAYMEFMTYILMYFIKK